MSRSDLCSPPILLSRSVKPVERPGQPSVPLVGGARHVHGGRQGRQEGLEPGRGPARFGHFVKGLLGFRDLLRGLRRDVHARGLFRDVPADLHELSPDREVADHLRVVARREGRDRGPGQLGQVRRPAKLLQSRIVLEEGLQGDRGGQRVLRDAALRHLEDPGMHRIVEVRCRDQGRNAVEDVVVGQDRAQELLLCLDVVRNGFLRFRARLPDLGYFVHDIPRIRTNPDSPT